MCPCVCIVMGACVYPIMRVYYAAACVSANAGMLRNEHYNLLLPWLYVLALATDFLNPSAPMS